MAQKIKILYLSSHSILEFNELKLFGELDYKYLTLGYYYNPNEKKKDPVRPSLPVGPNLFDKYKGDWRNEASLTKAQVDPFDVLIYMHEPISTQPRITRNWDNIKRKRVIYRSIGQSIRVTEKALAPLRNEGLEIIRYSPKEETIPFYCGSDALIRFYKDPEEYKDWTGKHKRVVTLAQNMKSRRGATNFDTFLKVTKPFERRLFGRDNENAGLIGGALSFENLKKELRENRVYFYTGTQPASYTLNLIEAMMTGIPVVALGPLHCNTDYPEQATYEVHEIIRNGENGFWSDDPEKLKEYISALLKDEELAKKISIEGRKTAIEYFGKEKIKAQWKKFLEK